MPLILRNCNPPPEALARGLEAAHAVLVAVALLVLVLVFAPLGV